jgi:hypothetical protein
MSVTVSKCSGWDGRVNELGDNEQGAFDTREANLVIRAGLARLARKAGRVGSFNFASRACRARLACLAHTSRTTYEEGGFLERLKQSLGNF